MTAERRRTRTQIHIDIEHTSMRHPHEFGLPPLTALQMQSTQHTAMRQRLIVLNEHHMPHMSLEFAQTERFHKIASRVTKTFRLYKPHTFYIGFSKLHINIVSRCKISKFAKLHYHIIPMTTASKPDIIFFDDDTARENLLPLSFTRPLALLRAGITTIAEKWQAVLPGRRTSYLTADYLQCKYPAEAGADNLFIAGNVIPSKELAEAISDLAPGETLVAEHGCIAFRGSADDFKAGRFAGEIAWTSPVCAINMLYDIFTKNAEILADDFLRLTEGRKSQPISATCTIVGDPSSPDGTPNIFIEEGATVEAAVLNVKNGPIYIGRDAEVMEGSCLRGPVAMLDHSVANMGCKIYGATTIGPYCKVGGELNNVVMIGFSNKAHDGFLGNAVIGEWCNLGAGCVASNLKNDYTEIKLWNYRAHRFLRTGLQFCGLIMGDHSKAGINTMFNTATVLGVGVNIHGSGFPRNFVASFSEGSTAGFSDVPLSKFFDIADRVMARRGQKLTEADRAVFQAIYTIADTYK